MVKYDGVLPRPPQVRPKSEIYTPKRDDEHLHPFHMRNPPPPGIFTLYPNIFILYEFSFVQKSRFLSLVSIFLKKSCHTTKVDIAQIVLLAKHLHCI